MAADSLTQFGVDLLQLLGDAKTNSSYKYALLVALIDLSLESVGRLGPDPGRSVTTRQIARRVLELYWPQARPWPGFADGGRLRAVQTGGRSIVDWIVSATDGDPRRWSPDRMRRERAEAWARLMRDTEEKFIRYPIPLLQTIGDQRVDLLYANAAWPRKGEGLKLGRYLADPDARDSGFDNRLTLLPGVEENLARLAPLVRPLVMEHWARWTERRARLEGEASVFDFLFGTERVVLKPLRKGLIALQDGACFYCGGALAGAKTAIDHFVPWSRTGCDDAFNLVAAHAPCNASKSDHLAARAHVDRWRRRLEKRKGDIEGLAFDVSWSAEPVRTLRVAASAYGSAGAHTRLWRRKGRFEPLDGRIVKLLRA